MRIAIFTDTYPPFINGVSTSCNNLVNVLKEKGHDVLVICPRPDDGPMIIEEGIIKMPGILLKKLYGYRMTKFYDRKVFHLIKKFNPDVIHTHTDFTVAIFSRFIAKKLHIPYIYTYHTSIEEYTYYVTHGFFDRAARWITQKYSKISTNNTTEFITPSDKTKDHIRSIGNERYINVIPSGIDFSLFADENDPEKVRTFKEQYHYKPETKTILLLGRLAQEKSTDYSIRCFAEYVKKHPEKDVRFVIVGDGPQKEEYELLAHELQISQKVHFIGFVPPEEVSFYYHLADIFTSASVTETQGLTYLEAMASGTIVLARFDNNLVDVIVEGHTGFFFSNEQAFVDKADFIFALNDEQREAIKISTRKMLEQYSIEKFYDNIIEVYTRAVRKYW